MQLKLQELCDIPIYYVAICFILVPISSTRARIRKSPCSGAFTLRGMGRQNCYTLLHENKSDLDFMISKTIFGILGVLIVIYFGSQLLLGPNPIDGIKTKGVVIDTELLGGVDTSSTGLCPGGASVQFVTVRYTTNAGITYTFQDFSNWGCFLVGDSKTIWYSRSHPDQATSFDNLIADTVALLIGLLAAWLEFSEITKICKLNRKIR
jgi:hypothetical protein